MQVLGSVEYQNKKALEPTLEQDILVAQPELNEDTIYSSNITFINMMSALDKLIESKMFVARTEHIDRMNSQSFHVTAHKQLVTELTKHGLAGIPAIDDNEELDIAEFKSCGDIKKDLANATDKMNKSQHKLLKLDEHYRPLHSQIKKLQRVKHDLSDFTDNYKIQLSQLNRVLERMNKHISDNKTAKESTLQAITSIKKQETMMVSKISGKMSQITVSISEMQISNPDRNAYENYLIGLREFMDALHKLQHQSESKIQHFSHVSDSLIEQRADMKGAIRKLKREAIKKLHEIGSLLNTFDMQSEDSDDDEFDDVNAVQLSDYNAMDIDSMVGLLHSREKYMSAVYKRLHDLQSRALTTNSSDYLHGLTEIRELQLIFANTKLKYFYNKFVQICSNVFNDCCLAYQALFEQTSDLNAPVLMKLGGVQMLVGIKKIVTRDILEIIVEFVQSIPDREIVIMQVARYLALSLPFRNDIINYDYTKEKLKEGKENEESLYSDPEKEKEAKHLMFIEQFAEKRIREWVGSILEVYGDSTFTSVKVALENDVVAQVRASKAAKLIVNCVYGLSISW